MDNIADIRQERIKRMAPRFVNGEISLDILDHIDVNKYVTAASRLKNFFPIASGAVLRRSWFEVYQQAEIKAQKKARRREIAGKLGRWIGGFVLGLTISKLFF